MIHSNDEEKAHQETEAAQSGEEARAFRGGAKEDMECEEEKIEIMVSELLEYFQSSSFELPILTEFEARILARRMLSALGQVGPLGQTWASR